MIAKERTAPATPGDPSGGGPAVVVTGVGVMTPLGDTPEALHEALCAGHDGLRRVQTFDADGIASDRVAEIADFSAGRYLEGRSLHPLDRTSRLLASAAGLALDSSGGDRRPRGPGRARARERSREIEEIGLVVGTMFGSVRTISEFDREAMAKGPFYAKPMKFANTVINAAAGQTAIWHGLTGANATVSAGTVSASKAVAYATGLIRSGQATVVLAGGVEELCFESLHAFQRAGLLYGSGNGDGKPVPFDARRDGFALGEAAGLLVLEGRQSARNRGTRPLAEIRGHGDAFDASRGEDDGSSVDALGRAIRIALDDAGVDAAEIGCLSASANGSVRGDRIEARGVDRALEGRSRALPVTAVKSMLGETLGAAGALQIIALVETLRSGTLPGVRGLEAVDEQIPFRAVGPDRREIDARLGLVTSVGLQGSCSALVVEVPGDDAAGEKTGTRPEEGR